MHLQSVDDHHITQNEPTVLLLFSVCVTNNLFLTAALLFTFSVIANATKWSLFFHWQPVLLQIESRFVLYSFRRICARAAEWRMLLPGERL
jgi:hypothetical protein